MPDKTLYQRLLESQSKPVGILPITETPFNEADKVQQSIQEINKAVENQNNIALIKRQREQELAQREKQADELLTSKILNDAKVKLPNAPQEVIDAYVQNRKHQVKSQAVQVYNERLDKKATEINDAKFNSIIGFDELKARSNPYKTGAAAKVFQGGLNTDFFEKDGQPTREFKKQVIELSGGDPQRMKEAAHAIVNNKIDEYETNPSEYQKAIQSFYDYAYNSNIPGLYKGTLAGASAIRGLADIGAFVAAPFYKTLMTNGEKSMGRLYGETGQLINQVLPTPRASNEAELSFNTLKKSPLSYLDAVLNNATRSAGEYVLPALLTGGEKTFVADAIGLGKEGAKKAVVETALANTLDKTLANSTANKAARVAYEGLSKMDGSKAINYLDNVINTSLAAGAPIYSSYYDQLLKSGYSPEEAASKAADRTAINILAESIVNPFGGHHVKGSKLVKKIFEKGEEEADSRIKGAFQGVLERFAGVPKDALGGGVEEVTGSLADSYQDFRDKKMRGEIPEDAQFDWSQAVQQAANEGIVGMVSEGALSAIGGHGRASSNPQSEAIAQAIQDRGNFNQALTSQVQKGKLSEKEGVKLNAFLNRITPAVEENIKNGLHPEMAVKHAIESERLKEVNEKLALDPTNESLLNKAKDSQKTLTQLENGTYIKGRTLSSDEISKLAEDNTPNGLKESQRKEIKNNGPYTSEVIDITPFAEELKPEIAIIKNPEIASQYKSELDPLLEEKEAIESKYRPKVDKESGFTLIPKREKSEKDAEDLVKINQQIAELKAQYEGLKGKEDVIGFTPKNEVAPIVNGTEIIDGKKRIAHALANGENEMEVARPLTNDETDEIVNEETDNIIGSDEPDFDGLNTTDQEHLEYAVNLFDLHEDPAKGYASAAEGLIQRGLPRKKVIDLLSRIQNSNQPKAIVEQYYNSVKNGKRKSSIELEQQEDGWNKLSYKDKTIYKLPNTGRYSIVDKDRKVELQYGVKPMGIDDRSQTFEPVVEEFTTVDEAKERVKELQKEADGENLNSEKTTEKEFEKSWDEIYKQSLTKGDVVDQINFLLSKATKEDVDLQLNDPETDVYMKAEKELSELIGDEDAEAEFYKKNGDGLWGIIDKIKELKETKEVADTQIAETTPKNADIPLIETPEERQRRKDAMRYSYPEFKIRRGENISQEEYRSLRESNIAGQTEKAYEDIAGLAPNKSTGRIAVDPIIGGKPKNISDIILDVSKNLKQRLFFMKPGRRKTIGTYSPGNSAVKIKYNGDLDTTAHEIGHSIDDHFGLLSDLATVSNLPLEMELLQLAPFGSNPPKGHPNPRLYKLGEGFAEWLRAYIANPTEAKKFTNIYNLYDSKVNEEYKKALDQFSTDFRTFAGSSGRDMTLSNVQFEPKKEKNVLQQIFSKPNDNSNFSFGFWDRTAANFVNPLRAFNKANEYLKGIKGIDEQIPEDDPTLLARTLLGVDGKVSELLESGMIDANLNVLKDENGNSKNLKWLLEPLDNFDQATIEKEKKDVVAYMIAERTVELSDRFGREDLITGIGGGIFKDVDVAKKALAEFEQDPQKLERIKEASKRYRELADDVLKYMVDKGRLSEEQYDNIKRDNTQYVALQRIQETEPDREVEVYKKGGNKLASKVEVVNKIKGSSKTIQDPYISLLDTVYKGVKESDRNEVLRTFRDLLVDDRKMYEGEQNRLSDIGVQAKQGDKETVTIFVDGQPEYWKFDKDVYKALKGLDAEGYRLPAVVTALPRLLRWSVTHWPVFGLRNIIRDTQDRLIKSNNNQGLSGLKDFTGDKEHWHEVARSGGLNAGYYLKDKDHYYGLMGEAMNEMAQNKKSIILDPTRFKEAWHGYTNILGKSETLNRVAEYRAGLRKAKEKGLDDYNSKLYAAYHSRDLLDFALMGTQMKWLNQLVPFSNAAVQGLRSSVVRAKEDPKGFAMRTLLFSVVPSIAVWLLAHSNDDDAKEYEELPDYQRDMFYNFKIGDNKWASIPKPYELSIFGAAMDRTLSAAYGNKKAFNGYAGSVLKSTMPFDQGNLAGPLMPIVEVLANKDFFRNKTIIPAYEEPLNLALRNTERASRLGQALQEISGFDARKWDHFIQGTGSYVGSAALKLSNIGREDGDKFNLSDLGVFKQTPAYNSKTVQEYLNLASEYQLNIRDFKELTKQYFAAETDEEKEQIAKVMIDYAQSEIDDLRALAEEKTK